MSLITYWIGNVNRSATSGRTGRTPAGFRAFKIIDPVRKAAVSAAKLLVRAIDAVAEARINRTMIEVELHRNWYRHSSKNDDDLPAIRPAVSSNDKS